MKKRINIALCCVISLVAFSCKKEIESDRLKINDSEKVALTNPNLTTTVGTNVQEFTEQIDASKERDRLGFEHWLWTDFEATGFYVAPNTSLSINVTQLQGASLPKIIIGTYYLHDNVYNFTPQTVQLKAGQNNITSDSKGGMIWVRFTTSNTPTSQARLTFNAGHQRVPIFIKNITTQSDWNNQLTTYATPDVLLIGDHVYQAYSRSYAQGIQPQDNSFVLEKADQGWKWENELSGLDGSSSLNQLHVHNRVLMTRTNDNTVGAYAYYYGTGYANSTHLNAFTPLIATEGWGVWHEMGHLRQQYIWKWSTLGEVTNNIFALFVERKMGITSSRLKRENRYAAALSFIANTDPNKDFNIMTGTYDDHFSRLVMFQQLYLAFGDQLFINIGKRARLESRNTSMSDEAKMIWFMKTACTVSGRNLTTFFRNWGFKVNASAYTEIANMGLPNPIVEPSTLTEDNVSSNIVNGGIYKIVSKINNSSVVDCNSSTPVNGTAVTLWSSTGGNNQKWLARKNSDGSFVFKSVTDTTKVLDVNGGATSAGTLIKMYTYYGNNNQKWNLKYVGSGAFNLSPLNAPNLVLDVNGGFSANGTALNLWTSNGGSNNQKFGFEKLN